MEEETIKIEALIPDDKNFNKGTLRGKVLLDRSFQKFGAGRSLLIDKNNRIIAGNKSVSSAISQGIRNVRIIETNGDELIAVKRTDIDLRSSKGREMALADNMTSKVNFSIDYNNIMQSVQEVQLDTEAWHIDLKQIAKEHDEAQKKLTKEEKREQDAQKFIFNGYVIDMAPQEYDDLVCLVEEYYDENGVVVGFIANLLDI